MWNLKENPGAQKSLLDKLASHAVDASELLEICRNWEFCPYQVSKLVLDKVHIVVCNYQWLFSPYIRDYFLESLDTSLDHVMLIIDEAHNFIRNVYSNISSKKGKRAVSIYDYIIAKSSLDKASGGKR